MDHKRDTLELSKGTESIDRRSTIQMYHEERYSTQAIQLSVKKEVE